MSNLLTYQTVTAMKKADFLLKLMDKLHAFVDQINYYIEIGLTYFEIAKSWVQQILAYLQTAIDKLVDFIGGRQATEDYLQFHEEDLFV